jgi:hypothetical protein
MKTASENMAVCLKKAYANCYWKLPKARGCVIQDLHRWKGGGGGNRHSSTHASETCAQTQERKLHMVQYLELISHLG